jgi:hypothetical protein
MSLFWADCCQASRVKAQAKQGREIEASAAIT